MNKFLKIINLTAISLIYITNSFCGNLSKAIVELDCERVEKLLQVKGSLSTAHKEKLLSIAIDLEKKYKAATSSIFKSKQDLLHAVAGGIFSLICGYSAYEGIKQLKKGLKTKNSFKGKPQFIVTPDGVISVDSFYKDDIKYGGILAVINTIGLCSFATLFYSGWTLSKAHSSLKKAQEIKNLIKNCSIKIENESNSEENI